jgi:UDP-2-acetamido-3-amino-2,3-dideoxy-glucuronate N-acetyltransferase
MSGAVASETRRDYFVHESAYVDEPADIGEGTRVWHFSHVMSPCTIGRNCTIGQNVQIAPRVRIGDRVKIQNNVSVYEGVELEDEVFCGPSMVFTNVTTPRGGTPRNRPEDYAPTLVKRGATLGANSTIVCGHTIGEFAFVGAGAVVTKDVPPYALVYGNPARVRGYACECGLRLHFADDDAAACESCGRTYRRENGVVERTQP